MITKQEFIEQSNLEFSGLKFNLKISLVMSLLFIPMFFDNFFVILSIFPIFCWYFTIKEEWIKRKIGKMFDAKINYPTQQLHTYILDNAFWEDINEQVVVTIKGRHYTEDSLKPSFNIYERKAIEHAFEQVQYQHELNKALKGYEKADNLREELSNYFKEE